MTTTLRMRSRMAAIALATVAAAGGAMAASAGPAAAATPTYDIVQSFTTSTVSSSKTATATCPTNEVVLGTGVEQGADGQVAVESLVPSKTKVTAYAHVDEDGYTKSWELGVWAVCGALPPNYSIQSGVSPSSTTSATATANCPSPTVALGTGWSTAPSPADDGQVIVGTVQPYGRITSAIDTVAVSAWPDQNGTSKPWTATAYAVCGSGITGLHRVDSSGPTGSTQWQGAITNCPSGEYVTGGGFAGGSSQVVLHSMAPFFNSSSGIHGLDTLMSEDEDGYSGNWTQTGYALCAKL